MCKISIIVPIYGVEDYIERCACSLFEQTLNDIEYIFVDDCSPDNSILKLQCTIECYPNRKDKVHIIRHNINLGLPEARHTGFLNASGEFILHCDSDDWLLPETCEELYNKAKEENSDVVVFDIQRTDGIYISSAKTTDIHQFTLDMMYMRSAWSVVNKMFKQSVYDVVQQFPTKNVAEDMGLCLQLIYGCKKMSYIPKPYYQYFINPASLSNSITIPKALRRYEDAKTNADLVLDFYFNKPISNDLNKALDYVKWSVRKVIYGTAYHKQYFKMWKDTYKGIEKSLLLNSRVRLNEKIRILLTYLRICPLKCERIYD